MKTTIMLNNEKPKFKVGDIVTTYFSYIDDKALVINITSDEGGEKSIKYLCLAWFQGEKKGSIQTDVPASSVVMYNDLKA